MIGFILNYPINTFKNVHFAIIDGKEKSNVETTNMSRYYFPISPKHMLLIAKESDPVNVISYRMADSDLVRKCNQIIASHSSGIIASTEKDRHKII